MLKKLLHTLLVVVMILSMSSQAMAADINEPADLNIYEYIQSKEVGQLIADTITLSENGTQSVYVGNGIMFTAEVKTTDSSVSRSASYRTKTGEASGRFYTVSDNQTVAEYSLSATFEYDGSSYVGIVGVPTRTEETVSNKWRLDGLTEELVSDTQYIVSGQWTLYQKVGFIWKKYEYNNNTHIDIICTPRGVITYNYK